MKKLMALILAGILVLTACGSNGQKEVKKAYDLEGEWKQVNSESDDSWQSAEIKNGEIIINWITDKGDTSSLYWAGTYEAPKTYSETYEWESKNDKSKTDNALLASGDDTKVFSFDGKQLSYKVSAMGTTTTVKLEKVK